MLYHIIGRCKLILMMKIDLWKCEWAMRACGLKELLWNLDRFQGLGETCDSLASRAVEWMLDLKENL